MVWVSNYSPANITVTITNKTGGSASQFTVLPSVSMGPAGLLIQGTKPEDWGQNHWGRGGTETLNVKIGEKETSFEVQKDDHVIFYTNAYEVFTSKFTQI